MERVERLSDFTDRQRRELASLDLMRLLSSAIVMGSSSIGSDSALDYFQSRWPRALYGSLIQSHVDYQRKAAQAPGVTTDPTFAGPLMAPAQLLEPLTLLVQQDTVLGRLGARKVPFASPLPAQTGNATFGWVGEGKPKPLTSVVFASITVPPAKASGIIVVSNELAKLSVPGSEAALQNALVSGTVQFVDAQFLDPAVAAVAGVHPASITNGVTPTTSTGTIADRVNALIAAFFAACPLAAAPALVMSPASAARLAGMTAQPTLTVAGGTYSGIPVVTSPSAATWVVMLDTGALVYGDGGVSIDVSREAAIQMDTAPDSPATAATVITSLWQYDLAGFKVEDLVSWVMARPNSVAYTVVA